MDALDYALIRLAEPVGDDAVVGGTSRETRGHIQLGSLDAKTSIRLSAYGAAASVAGELQFAIGQSSRAERHR